MVAHVFVVVVVFIFVWGDPRRGSPNPQPCMYREKQQSGTIAEECKQQCPHYSVCALPPKKWTGRQIGNQSGHYNKPEALEDRGAGRLEEHLLPWHIASLSCGAQHQYLTVERLNKDRLDRRNTGRPRKSVAVERSDRRSNHQRAGEQSVFCVPFSVHPRADCDLFLWLLSVPAITRTPRTDASTAMSHWDCSCRSIMREGWSDS